MLTKERAISLNEKIRGKTAKVAVVGMGYVGLPLALRAAEKGFPVLGVEHDGDKVAKLQSGESYITDITDRELKKAVASGMTATSDWDQVRDSDIVVLCLPTPLDRFREPDLSYLQLAGRELSNRIKPGMLIISESTSYPGTTEEVLKPLIEEGGLVSGKDFYLAYSPERVDPGNKNFPIEKIPKLVGGVCAESSELALQFYGNFIDSVVKMSSPRVAEMAKLLENIYRCVNIALVNELSVLCERMDIDLWEVIEGASTKPFGFTPFYPGPGLGGHCIPVDPFYLSWKAREFGFYTEFIELAGKVNESMPYEVVRRIANALNTRTKSIKDSRILIMGISYKKDVPDIRESPSLKIINLLQKEGAEIVIHDPFVPNFSLGGQDYVSEPLTKELLNNCDIAVILTDHTQVDYGLVSSQARLILDTRNVIKQERTQKSCDG